MDAKYPSSWFWGDFDDDKPKCLGECPHYCGQLCYGECPSCNEKEEEG
ncbi:MAG: hypothetical protein FWE89_04250 [Syntrophaceae bacterium]|nr:hypothetical protein [Syntrophaceae bacterium]